MGSCIWTQHDVPLHKKDYSLLKGWWHTDRKMEHAAVRFKHKISFRFLQILELEMPSWIKTINSDS